MKVIVCMNSVDGGGWWGGRGWLMKMVRDGC